MLEQNFDPLLKAIRPTFPTINDSPLVDYSRQLNLIRISGYSGNEEVKTSFKKTTDHIYTHLNEHNQLSVQVRLNKISKSTLEHLRSMIDLLNDNMMLDKNIQLLWFVQQGNSEINDIGTLLKFQSKFPFHIVIL